MWHVFSVSVHAECSSALHCEGLSKHAHFRNFGMAFLTLFRVATGDNWNGIMKVSCGVDVSFFGVIAPCYIACRAYATSMTSVCLSDCNIGGL